MRPISQKVETLRKDEKELGGTDRPWLWHGTRQRSIDLVEQFLSETNHIRPQALLQAFSCARLFICLSKLLSWWWLAGLPDLSPKEIESAAFDQTASFLIFCIFDPCCTVLAVFLGTCSMFSPRLEVAMLQSCLGLTDEFIRCSSSVFALNSKYLA